MATHRSSFAAMGATATVAVVAASRRLARAAVASAHRAVIGAEARWSRFLPDSDVGRLNRNPGRPVAVDPSTIAVLERSLAGWISSGGRFSPFVGCSVSRLGYGETMTGRWADVNDPRALLPVGTGVGRQSAVPAGSTALDPVGMPLVIDHGRSTATLAVTGLDLGGIGKGAAADLAVAAARSSGATSACVEIGGDLALSGDEPWTVEIEDPFRPGTVIARAGFVAGGIATSSVTRRRWRDADGVVRHHLVDPRTGLNPQSRITSVTVAAADAATAEVMTKDLLVSDLATMSVRLADSGLDVLVVADDGSALASGAWTMGSR